METVPQMIPLKLNTEKRIKAVYSAPPTNHVIYILNIQ